MAKEINFCGAKNALVRIDVEAILTQALLASLLLLEFPAVTGPLLLLASCC